MNRSLYDSNRFIAHSESSAYEIGSRTKVGRDSFSRSAPRFILSVDYENFFRFKTHVHGQNGHVRFFEFGVELFELGPYLPNAGIFKTVERSGKIIEAAVEIQKERFVQIRSEGVRGCSDNFFFRPSKHGSPL